MDVTVYHNSACGTSRGVLALLEERGITPIVIEYLQNPPTRDEVRALADNAGVPLRALLRENAPPYAEMGLGDESLSDDALLDAIDQHPILLNRPIVVTPKGTALCRPKEKLLDLL
ncbi:arsenate reductase (glutaredoxin) [Sphingomonas glaciei]|uniref:Arsenate reductase n=1 Tax=Sphingomonas glaciei TaxID=2938948 RepID=A0ABY5MZQ8_9SPHN|nr:arsenate reductase (glutaredoxin) [Sphingomonas glaciei]UUR08792.1 arsenate reductase (glutaredoxin) [Sphingomonas glaciei]